MAVMPEHIDRMKIKVQGGREYLPVAARLLWFRGDHPDWSIITEPVEINHEKQFSIFRTTIMSPDGRVIATATKKEDLKGFGDYVEKAETGSVGRALAYSGYGTLSDEDEMAEPVAARQVDGSQPPQKSNPTAVKPSPELEALKIVTQARWPDADEAEAIAKVWEVAIEIVGKEPDPVLKTRWPLNVGLIKNIIKKIEADSHAQS